MTTRKYSSRSQQTTLTGALTSSGTSATVVSGSALLGGVTISAGETFTVVIDPDTALEEIVDVTAVSTNTLTITRAIDGSINVSARFGTAPYEYSINNGTSWQTSPIFTNLCPGTYPVRVRDSANGT